MNVLVSVRDTHGVLRTRAFDPDEAAKARAYLGGIVEHVAEHEQRGVLRAMDALDRIIDPTRAFEDIYTPANYRPGWSADA